MKPQKPTPPRNARTTSSSPTSIPAPANQTPTSSAESRDNQDDEKLEDVLKKWSSTPARKSLPFLNDLHKVGRLYDGIVKSRSQRRQQQFDAFDETRSHLANILKSDDKKSDVSTTPGPKQLARNLLDHPDLKHLKVKKAPDVQAAAPSTPVLKKTGMMFPGSNGPTAPGSKVSDVTPWRRPSPPTPTPSRKVVGLEMPDTPVSTTSPSTMVDTSPSSPLHFTKPIPVRTKDSPISPQPSASTGEKDLLPALDLPLPPMRAVLPASVDAEAEKHPHLKPMYTQSYVNGVVEAMKHAHATIVRMSQDKREVEARLEVLEEKQSLWHALVHGQGCGCGEVRWWRELEEVLIERREEVVIFREEGEREKVDEGDEEGGEKGRFGMDGACDEGEVADEEDAWDVLGSPVFNLQGLR